MASSALEDGPLKVRAAFKRPQETCGGGKPVPARWRSLLARRDWLPACPWTVRAPETGLQRTGRGFVRARLDFDAPEETSCPPDWNPAHPTRLRSEEHTSELQSPVDISYA